MKNENNTDQYKYLMKKFENTSDYDVMKTILNRVDLISVAEEVDDEYGPENVRILEGLPKCKTANDVKLLVFRVIAKMLGDDVAVRNDNYLRVTEGIIKEKDKFAFRVWF